MKMKARAFLSKLNGTGEVGNKDCFGGGEGVHWICRNPAAAIRSDGGA